MGLAADDVIMPLAPMFHANAWSTPYLAPMVGAKLVLPGPRLDGKSVQSLINTEGVTFTVAVPTVFTMLFEYLDSSGSHIESLKRAVIGGSPVPPSMIERLASIYGCTVLQMWGMTETSPLGTMCTPTPALDTLSPDDRRKKLQTAGRVQYGMELKIVGSNGERLSHDGKNLGDLWVRSGWAAKGYFRDETSKLDADGWFPTGDVATIDDLGYMRITDRTKDVIKSGGEWISSVDVEGIVYAHPAVRMAAVVGAAHPKWEERPVLIVALKESQQLSEKELIEFLRPRMARWWLPDRVFFVSEMPMTATGKIRKMVLRERYREILHPRPPPRRRRNLMARVDRFSVVTMSGQVGRLVRCRSVRQSVQNTVVYSLRVAQLEHDRVSACRSWMALPGRMVIWVRHLVGVWRPANNWGIGCAWSSQPPFRQREIP